MGIKDSKYYERDVIEEGANADDYTDPNMYLYKILETMGVIKYGVDKGLDKFNYEDSLNSLYDNSYIEDSDVQEAVEVCREVATMDYRDNQPIYKGEVEC